MLQPPYLRKGDTIGIVCPSGYMPAEKAAVCIQTLKSWGFKVRIGKTLGNQFHYFAGTDAERLADLQDMLDDPAVKAILCGRGGYGMSRIVDQLNFKAFKKSPKWVIGFSDITILHAQLYKQCKTASLHAPMAAAFNDGGAADIYVQSLRKVLVGQKPVIAAMPHPFNRRGTATAELVGGNLSLVAHLIGSPSAYPTKNRILFLEDVGEYLYNIDRMMIQLKRAGVLDALAGLIIGGFSDMKDTTIPFGNTVEEIIRMHIPQTAYPVCFGFPVSHEKENMPVKVGGVYTLTVTPKNVRLREQ